jgi:hypothetical protein
MGHKVRRQQTYFKNEKPRLVAFPMANHWPPKGPRQRLCLRDVKLRFAAGPIEPGLCSPDLRRRTRSIASHLRRWLPSLYAVDVPFTMLFIINYLTKCLENLIPIYGSLGRTFILEFIEYPRILTLTVGAIVCTAASHDHAPNRSFAYPAGLSGAEINAMLELEEAGYAGRIHVVRNR